MVATSTLTILFVKMLKFSKKKNLKKKKFVKEIKKSFGIFYLSPWNFQKKLIIQQTFCCEVALVLQY
jgi:hypothetical protein